MSDTCEWLHRSLRELPILRFPFQIDQLPNNGIYFLYEDGEVWGHGGHKPRIVRIGTHNDGNFQSRISEHFLLDEARKMDFGLDQAAPKDRSIFRKHIGRAILNKQGDPYLSIWNYDFMESETRARYWQERDIEKERRLEKEITTLIRESFSFRFIVVEDQAKRIGLTGLERPLIGTRGRCSSCRAAVSNYWLGRYSPRAQAQIRESGLWLIQHLKHEPLNLDEQQAVEAGIKSTLRWFAQT